MPCNLQAQARAIEESPLRIKPGGTHGVVQGIHLVAQHKCLGRFAVNLPAVFVELHDSQRFTVLMLCSWNGDDGVLDEDFTYSDGTKQKRIWRLKKLPDGRYTGRADDVVGEAQGQIRGNTFYWTYTLNLPVDGRNIEVQFDDWMYLMTDKVMLNKATMSKFGVRLGEVTLSFTKR